MAELIVNLPDELAQRAGEAGLLTSEAIEALLREKLREQAGKELRAMVDELAADGTPAMSEEEIRAEIDAYRADRRAAPRSNA